MREAPGMQQGGRERKTAGDGDILDSLSQRTRGTLGERDAIAYGRKPIPHVSPDHKSRQQVTITQQQSLQNAAKEKYAFNRLGGCNNYTK